MLPDADHHGGENGFDFRGSKPRAVQRFHVQHILRRSVIQLHKVITVKQHWSVDAF
ncbi:hypothetical protein ACFSRY_18775 [Pontibacter locisalis]|uniref:Uncharacterized protein n=2 Tax=Pontibacter locisalis TaxID=1719035 RepID=A0ABW5IR48_9BACT